ncbi:endonuclease/exonuclease/phosphatase family protein [Photobacterium sp. WH24]|uniref:endonuclease/exonuclease/phosphatase family protein n=1 Tax=Photobacterium sp. WH24 TaxID=2827237 RepID=UPI001C48CDD6|nr:endonuclease/exonuclease/phosphatase family protein [Photobacterium sp. WH24]MBV7262506.1 endonuclease/exonuclease/phosphatase family protein [Photobacterium sp. WH24]
MRVAAFNVENLFDRVKAFNDETLNTHNDILDAHAALNKLFEKKLYSSTDKTKMLELMGKLGILNKDEGPFVWLRKIRGKIVVRPRKGSVRIEANGREDWVGWLELKTAPVDEKAITMTARMIRDMSADVLALVEIESRPVLIDFHDLIYAPLSGHRYKHMMVIDGNDRRGIDVGIMANDGFSIPSMRSHVDEEHNDKKVFSRDCPEYILETPGGEKIAVLPNHFKSKYGGNNKASRDKREAQAQFTARYYERLLADGIENVIVLGDLNDTPDSNELRPLLNTSLREVTEHPAFTEFEFFASTGDRGIGTLGSGADSKKIDYILLSPALWAKVQRGGIFRKGIYTASGRWQMYEELTKTHYAASDHHGIWVDLDLT